MRSAITQVYSKLRIVFIDLSRYVRIDDVAEEIFVGAFFSDCFIIMAIIIKTKNEMLNLAYGGLIHFGFLFATGI